MARPASGSVRWNSTTSAWEVRVTLANGTRSRPIAMTGLAPCIVAPADPPRGCSCEPCTVAHESGRAVSRRMRDGAAVDAATRETCNEWFERYHAYQVELGQTDAVKKRHRWLKWIAPKIGTKAMALVTRDDIEDIRDALDAAIAEWEPGKAGHKGTCLTGKTAMNVWSCLTSSFKAATASKRRDLRVRNENPCLGVLPPGDRATRKARRKPFLYPREAFDLLACEAVPLEWREVYALALYLYLRPGELRVLTVADIDVTNGTVRITKAWDYEDAKVKPPKTSNGVRTVPFAPTLAPLLERMLDGKKPGDLVVPQLAAFGEDHLAQLFRAHLMAAKVERAELHESTRTHVQSNFRSCRDSGITWLAMSGLGVDKIMRRAGHDMVQTTMGYVKLAEDLGGSLGTPFAPLPKGLLGSGSVSVENGPNYSKLLCRRRESNPRPSAYETPALTN